MALLAVLIFGTSLLCLGLFVARNRVNRRHRVDPAVPTDAPLTWLVDPRAPARLHRRLAKVGTTATLVADDHRPRPRRRLRRADPPSPLAATAEDLRAQAVLLDVQVTRLAVLAPKARQRPLVELGRAIAELEVAGARLVALSAQARAPRGLDTDGPALTEITRRIDHLAEAHQELLDLDAEARLVEQPLPAPPLVARPAPPAPASRPAPVTRPATAPATAPQPQTWPPSAPGARR